MIRYYARDSFEDELCNTFDKLTKTYPQIDFFQPSPEKAPWHIQAVLRLANGDETVLNFWPHKAKAQRQGESAIEGANAARYVIDAALVDQARIDRDPEADDLTERYDAGGAR